MTKPKKPFNILFVTSTFPTSETDPVPAFIKDEAIWFKKLYPHTNIKVLAPHSAYSPTKSFSKHQYYNEYRFHYFWPFKWELLAGRGIQPALKKNKLLYFQLPFLFIGEFFAVLHHTRRLKPDLIYAHWFTPQAIASALVSKICKVPFVFDTQASDVIVLKKLPFSKRLVASVCKQAHAYTAPSQQTADKLLHFSTEKNRTDFTSKLHMIPLGTSPVTVSPKDIINIKNKYGLSGKKVIYFIGRLVDRKGVDILIQAFAEMNKEDPSLCLFIVGEGPDKQKLEKQAKDLGVTDSVIFAGFLSGKERFALLEAIDVGVIPSINVGDHAEGLPIVFMEGITSGKTMVISDATGAHEFAESGVNAFIAKAGSPDSLKENLIKALAVSSSKNKEFEANVKTLAKKYQWPEIIKRRYEVFISPLD